MASFSSKINHQCFIQQQLKLCLPLHILTINSSLKIFHHQTLPPNSLSVNAFFDKPGRALDRPLAAECRMKILKWNILMNIQIQLGLRSSLPFHRTTEAYRSPLAETIIGEFFTIKKNNLIKVTDDERRAKRRFLTLMRGFDTEDLEILRKVSEGN